MHIIREQENIELSGKELVSISIVNWNGGEDIKKCLESLRRQSYKNIEVIVVDNHSTDGSLEFLKSDSHSIKLIENKDNMGFSKAHNQAIKIYKGEYILILNFDIIFSSNFVEEMLKAANLFNDIGMVSGKLYKKFEYNISDILDTTGITMNNMYPSDRGENTLDSGQFAKHEFVFGASGAAPLYKRKMLEDVKVGDEYFDEDFFIYVEDVDLAWRAQLYGWRGIYTPEAIAYHERGATRRDDERIRKGYYTIGYRNRYLAIFKNSLISNILKHLPKILIRETWFYLSHLYQKNFYVLKVPFLSLKLLPIMVKKRREVQNKRKVSKAYMEKFFFSPSFFKKKQKKCR